MVPDAAVTHHLVPEDDQAQVVDILTVVLLHVHSGEEKRMSFTDGEEDEIQGDFFFWTPLI